MKHPAIVLPTPDQFMRNQPRLPNGNTVWGQAYAGELRGIIYEHASQAPRTLQLHLGPSELGVECDRQVAAKMAGIERTNNVFDPWASIVGTALHLWFAECFAADNGRHGLRWLVETRVTPHPDHPGTADLYDAWNRAVVDHKGVHVDTPIATPDGWTTVGCLRIGNHVFGKNGRPCEVTRVYPVQERACYRVTFADGSYLITDDVQELNVAVPRGNKLIKRTISVADAAELVWSKTPRPQRQLRVYNPAALELPERDLPVHPYVLGCWLGDGSKSGGTISKPDNELFEHIMACGYKVSEPHGKSQMARSIYGLSTQLQTLGLQWRDENYPDSHGRLNGHREIPVQYLRASHGQRLSLLQGLMDTDGTWNKTRRQAVFTTTNKGLAYSTAELVTSLGWKVKVFPQQAHGFGLTVTAYHVSYTPFGDNPFRLSRKANLVRLKGSTQSRYRLVQSIEPTVTVPTRCIDVDSPDHLYLAGEQLVPVHNCLGPTSLAKVKADKGPPRHYVVQLLLYGLGFRKAGLPVDRVVLAAYPRTKSTLTDLYVWEHLWTPADDALLQTVFAQTAVRQIMAKAIVAGDINWMDVPATPDDNGCFYCEFYRPEVSHPDSTTRYGCPGTTGGHRPK